MGKANIGNNKQEIIVGGFMITNTERLEEFKARRKRKSEEKTANKQDPADEIRIDDIGGKIFCIDPKKLYQGALGTMDIFYPSGLLYEKTKNRLFVGSNHDIKVISKGKIIDTLNNNLFNCIHGLANIIDSKDILVTSTGIDTILSIDPDHPNNTKYIRNATEHGYNMSPRYEKRKIDLTINHQGINYPTWGHTTHINSAINHTQGKILATLFHQGQLIEIDMHTGKSRIVVEGLTNPHGIKKNKDGYIVSDTKGSGVVLLNKNLQIQKIITGNFNRIQDSEVTQDGNIIVADSNNGRLVKMGTNGSIIDEWNYGTGKRIGRLIKVTSEDIKNIF